MSASSNQALIERQNQNLEKWGDRPELREMATRIKLMVPNAASLTDDEALALAQGSYLSGLNPFDGEIYYIPKLGLYPGIKGRRRKAREQMERAIGRGANYWMEFDWPSSEWKAENGYAADWLVCRAILRDSATLTSYVDAVLKLTGAIKGMSISEVKELIGQRPYVTGIGFVKPGERLIRPIREVAQKRAERAALAQRFDIGLEERADHHDDEQDDSGAFIDAKVSDGPKWDQMPEEKPKQDTPQVVTTEPSAESPASEKTYRMAKVKFNGMTPTAWHELCATFSAAHTNWQLDDSGQPNMNHILASAGKAGFEFITAENVMEMFAAIVARHAAKDEH